MANESQPVRLVEVQFITSGALCKILRIKRMCLCVSVMLLLTIIYLKELHI